MATDLVPKPLYLNIANTYNGDELRQPWEDIILEGVVGINDYLVVAKGGTAANPDAGGGSRNQSVDILGLAGASAWVLGDTAPNTDGIYRQRAGAVTINEALGANASGSTRIDLVILEILPGSLKGNTRVVAGTPGSGVPPALPNNSIPLASVSCVNGFTVIAAAQITDLRTRAVGQVTSVVPGADVVLTDNAWTDICTLPLLTLANDRTIRFEAKAEFSNTHVTQIGLIALRIIDTSQGSAFVVGTGKSSVGSSTSGVPNWAAMVIAESLPVIAGAHTYKLQAFKTQGTVSVIKAETLASQALVATRLAVGF